MRTLFLQLLVAVLNVVLGFLAMRVSRHAGSRARDRAPAWEMTGWAFLLPGGVGVALGVGAYWAVLSGPGSAPYHLLARMVPAANYARTCARIAFGIMLCASVAARRLPAWLGTALMVGMLLAAIGAGAVIGLREGPLVPAVHYVNYSVFEAAELITVLAALLFGLHHSSMDRSLWLLLAVYATRQSMNALMFTRLVWLGHARAYSISPITVQMVGVAAYLGMISLAVHRLVLARRGVPVPPMLATAQLQPRMFA